MNQSFRYPSRGENYPAPVFKICSDYRQIDLQIVEASSFQQLVHRISQLGIRYQPTLPFIDDPTGCVGKADHMMEPVELPNQPFEFLLRQTGGIEGGDDRTG